MKEHEELGGHLACIGVIFRDSSAGAYIIRRGS